MAITSARMQQKRGEEFNFDPDKMLPGEWAVSTDTKYVRMCFSPGVCVRMATYEAFEADMAQITAILEEAKTVQEAVEKINLEISDKLNAVIEYSEQTKQYRDEAEQFRNEAFSATPDGYEKLVTNVTENTVKIDTIIEKAELNIKNTASGENIHLTDSANSKVVEFGLYGKATQDGEPTPDNPIEIVVSGSDGSVEVVSCGKNLLNNTSSTTTSNGVTFTVNNDGSVTASGTASAETARFVAEQTLKDGTYILSGRYSDAFSSRVLGYKDGSLVQIANTRNSDNVSFTMDNSVYNKILVQLGVLNGTTLSNATIYPMISIDGGEYEPYTETVSTILTPNGLCGIKVSSGGNYTDENGQQWITDEIVKYADGSGKRVQRIGKKTYSGKETWSTISTSTSGKYRMRVSASALGIKPPQSQNYAFNGICTIGKTIPAGLRGTYDCVNGVSTNDTATELHVYSDSYNTSDISLWTAYLVENPMTLYYELATPIITDLSAEEIAEIEKLHTFYPITNIFNDADCGMSITYLADSKNYIDGQLAIQKDQQEEALATMLLLMPEEVQASMIENDTNNLLNESEV